jgi:hypothetical protein
MPPQNVADYHRDKWRAPSILLSSISAPLKKARWKVAKVPHGFHAMESRYN